MLARFTLLRRTAGSAQVQYQRRLPSTSRRRTLVTNNPHKRALSKNQLEGEKAAREAAPPAASAAATAETAAPAPMGGGSSTKPADVGKAAADAGGAGGGGGGALFPLLLLASVGVGGAYYNRLIPEEYLPEALQGENPIIPKKELVVKVDKGLKEVVDEVTKKHEAAATPALEEPVEEKVEAAPSAAPVEEEVLEEEEVSLEHPEGGNRVGIDEIGAFYKTVNASRARQTEEEAREAAARAAEYSEADETQVDPMSAMTTAANAMAELQSTAALRNSQTLAAAKAALRSDLDANYFADLDKLSSAELRNRVVQLATEMSDRTKWEAVRLKEFLAMKEKEVGDGYLEILQKQRLEFEALLAQKLREQEDSITRQANAALAAKEEGIQSLLKATGEAREQEMKEALTEETKRIAGELELHYEGQLQNGLAVMKERHAEELEGHVAAVTGLQRKLAALESRLEVSQNYESGSRRAHRVSGAALALASKLEGGEGAAVELAALRGATGGEGVIASALETIPKRAEAGVPTLSALQATFDETYSVGREAAMIPEGRAGLEGQLLGKFFAKLSVPPSPDAVPMSEKEGSVADGILSLARKYVHLGDLEKAVEQLDKLKGQTAYVMNDWKSKAKDRVLTEQALKVIKLECALLNEDLVNSDS